MSSPACGANPHLLFSLRLREHSILPMVSCTMLIQTSSLVFVHGVPEDTHISTHLGSDDIRGRPDQIYAIFAVHFERAFSKSANVRIMFLLHIHAGAATRRRTGGHPEDVSRGRGTPAGQARPARFRLYILRIRLYLR